MKSIKRTARIMFDVFMKQRVTRSAAAMSYYLTMSIFPSLIVVYAVLTSLNISNENLYRIWEQIIPKDVLRVILDYLKYVGGRNSTVMLVVGIGVTFTSSSTVFGSFMSIMADIQGRSRYKGFWAKLFSFAVSLGFLVVIYASGIVIVSGEWLLDILEKSLGSDLLELWQWVRFALLFILLLLIIYLIYLISAPREKTRVRRMPGAFIASVLLVTVSIIFSHFISISTNYPIVYGSLASFIILMLWIYFCSIILIMGNVFNFAVYHKNLTDGGLDKEK